MANKVIGIDCAYSSSLLEVPDSGKGGIAVGDKVIFKDEEGKEEYGVIKYVNQPSADDEKILYTSKVLRRTTANDLQKVESHLEQTDSALEVCKKLVKGFGLEMNIFRVGYSFDGSKVHFTFTADERVDFRDLVKELARSLKKQIHLRQIGPRDKAKNVGGYGRCGRSLCCNTFLGKLVSINMEMVREQGLESKGSSKLSGACGKLLCCLKYEAEAYKELRKNVPAVGSTVQFKKNVSTEKSGYVFSVDVLNQKMRVQLASREDVITIGPEDVDKILKKPIGDRS
ncbi:MAG: regulatory iron-sulfur-containing complex subunit RicT [Nitrospirota bacterium]